MSALSPLVRAVLLVSLSLNLLLAAGLGALWWRLHNVPPPADAVEARSLPDPRRIARALPPERRALVRAALSPDRAAFAEDLRALRAAHAEVRDALRAQPYVESDLRAALAEVRERERAMAERVHAGLQRLATELTDAERAQLADSVPRRDHQRGRGGEHSERHRGGRENDSRREKPED